MYIIFEDEKHVMADGSLWHLIVYDEDVIDLEGKTVKAHSLTRVLSDVEQAEQTARFKKQERIEELKITITNKKLLDMDCTAEQIELKDLLGL